MNAHASPPFAPIEPVGEGARFNLSDWALGHKVLVLYLMVVSLAAGIWAYQHLSRNEDPPFTIKTMVVRALWPGASTADVTDQLTDRIEKKLQETPYLDNLQSYSRPGESVVFVNLKDYVPAGKVPDIWYAVRKKVEDIATTLPQGVVGPFFNDEFGDTFGIIYAFTADGFSYRQLRDRVDDIRAGVLGVKDIGKAELLGIQEERIDIEFSPSRLAMYGLDANAVFASLRAQNVVAPSGVVQTPSDKILVRVSGSYDSEESVAAINLFVNGRFVRLSDIAEVKRNYVDPPSPMFRFDGTPAIGLAISMADGGNLLEFGEAVRERIDELMADVPVGIEAHLVADQPEVVDHAVHHFLKTLLEAIAIVLAISFVSLGMRAGLVVALSIPLVLAITFAGMHFFDIGLQRISLGALIIALGLLVDDAMITVESMVSKLEVGAGLREAATFAYTSTAFPMLTGTLVTIAGFIPVGFAASSAGEYCVSMFIVVTISLVASWVVAILFSPLIGVYLLPKTMKHQAFGEGRLMRAFGRALELCMRRKWITIGATLALFAVALFGARHMQQQFFPSSDRPEVFITLTMPQSASIGATDAETRRVEALLKDDPRIERFSTYVGSGAVRFYLPMDVQLAHDNIAQIIVVTKGGEARDSFVADISRAIDRDFPNLIGRVVPMEMGPPVGWPLKYRVVGEDAGTVRDVAFRMGDLLATNPDVRLINMTWGEPQKAVRVGIDQDKARAVGISSERLSFVLNAIFSGARVTSVRDGIRQVDVMVRARDAERLSLETIRSLQVATGEGGSVPLGDIASIEYGLDQPIVWRRNRDPMIIVQADITPGLQALEVVEAMAGKVAELSASLPPGYRIEVAGALEESAKAKRSIAAVVPAMLLVMMTLLMFQLQSLQRLVLVVAMAPLGVIGIVAAMLPTGTPVGFVAILGVISLIGMIIRNGVILLTQIDENIEAGLPPWQSVIEATRHRLRPILLTAAAAILGMIPIAFEVFWGPMAFAVMGGLLAATVLTVILLPTAYVAWFRIALPDAERDLAPPLADATNAAPLPVGTPRLPATAAVGADQ